MDRAVTLVKGELPDWYTIEWAEHENRYWTEAIGVGSFALRYSGRVADACVEGTASEMQAIAEAIEQESDSSFYRCAAVRCRDGYNLFSPRNSQVPGWINMAQAKHLASEIRRVLGATHD